MNIYVGNISFDASEDEVRALFSAYGEVTNVNLLKDKFTGQPRGFGFVEMSVDGEAQTAIRELNGRELRGRKLTCNGGQPFGEVNRLSVVPITIDGNEKLGLDLAEAVEHAALAKIRRAGGPDCTERRHRQHQPD